MPVTVTVGPGGPGSDQAAARGGRLQSRRAAGAPAGRAGDSEPEAEPGRNPASVTLSRSWTCVTVSCQTVTVTVTRSDAAPESVRFTETP